MAEPDGGRHSRRWTAAGGVLAAALSCACGNSLTQPSAVPSPIAIPTPTPTPPPPPRVALISIDGLRADAVSAENTPNIWALVARGAYSFSAQTIFPSNTLPGHASMLTGVEPTVHGITFDEYQDTFQFSTPTALSLVHAAGKRSVMVVGKDKFRQLVGTGIVDSYTESKYGDEDIVNEAITRIPLGFDLLFVHLPQVDQVGHYAGWMSAAYLEQVKAADAAFGRLATYLPLGTTILVTSDHGGAAEGARDHREDRPHDPVDHRRPARAATRRDLAQRAHDRHGAHDPGRAQHHGALELHGQVGQRDLRSAVASAP